MTWFVTFLGAALVLAIVRDMFHTIWHPTRHGGLSRLVMTGMWRLSSRLGARRRAAGLAGPLGMVCVVAVWALTVAVGWALIYWPHMPEGFSYSSGLVPAEHTGPVDALYVSLVTLTTLGLGDIAPAEGWLRVVGPLESLVGFALLSATVAWILGVYPALARRRTLALRLSHVRGGVTSRELDSDGGATVLNGLASTVSAITVDFLQYTESYYFYDGDENISLPRQIDHAVVLAELAASARHPDAQLAARVLRRALDDLAAVLDERFLHTGAPTAAVFASYARDHGTQTGSQPAPGRADTPSPGGEERRP